MNQDWILQKKETRRIFANATWVPLRASSNDEHGQVRVTEIGYVSEFFGCGSVAFPPEHREVAERLSWSDIGMATVRNRVLTRMVTTHPSSSINTTTKNQSEFTLSSSTLNR